MKRCFKCGVEQPFTSFYKHPKMADGHLGKCKECTKKDTTANRLAKIEHYRQYDKMRAAQPHRMKLRDRVAKEYAQQYPNRRRANNAVSNALKAKKIERWPCQVCGDPKSVAHHPDYDNPLGVVWLCQVHHKAAHALVTEAA